MDNDFKDLFLDSQSKPNSNSIKGVFDIAYLPFI